MKQRLAKIDALKAFAIFTVVMGHTYYRIGINDSFVDAAIGVFFMPLFFFLSGLFATKPLSVTLVKRKSVSLLLPFVCMGVILCLLTPYKIGDLLFGHYHAGYWFILALFVMHISWSICLSIADKTNLKKNGSKDLIALGISVLFVFGFGTLTGLHHYCGLSPKIASLLCSRLIFHNFPFFICGYYWTRYNAMIADRAKHILYFFSVVFFVGYLIIDYSTNIHNSLLGYLASFGGVYFFLYAFDKLPHFIAENKLIKTVGTHTLEIYLLHYYFLPNYATIGNFAKEFQFSVDSSLLSQSAMGGVNA